MKIIKAFSDLNTVIVVILTLAYLYQAIYTVIGLVKRRVKPQPEAARLHRFAALISARNESRVIAELVESLKKQKYPAELFDVYVLADNCTDDTAARAKKAGARVYERRDMEHVGKGYALDYLLKKIKGDGSIEKYDGYFVFDADNIVDENFVAEMNKTYDRGYEAATCYRNSKNFAANWIAAGYSTWFLREARFLNYPRMLLKTGCAVSGTGFMVSDGLIEANGGWPFNLLTEDIQFSVDCAVKGRKIGYCDSAIVYDEQPTAFSQSWKQRKRWSKGFFQIDRRYLPALVKGIFKNKGARLTCYDMLMTVAPCMLLTLAVFALNIFAVAGAFSLPRFLMRYLLRMAGEYLLMAAVNYYLGMLAYGLLTVISEWKRIKTGGWDKIKYLWTFPLFIATYIPITISALLGHVEWTHIEHYSSSELAAANRKS